jgi:septal ring factor EnvC (AmiA/AmiB activator)
VSSPVSVWEWLLRGQPLIIALLGGLGALLLAVFRMHIVHLVRDMLGGMASKTAVEAAVGRIDLVDGRLAIIDAQMRHMPTADDVASLKVQLAELRGDTRSINTHLSKMERTSDTLDQRLDRIENHLLEGRR